MAVTPDISVILPSLRPTRVRECIKRIAATSAGVDYEIVLVSPLDMASALQDCPGYERIRFVRETEKRGSCWANTLGWENARGRYVFALADDLWVAPGCLESMVRFMKPHDGDVFLGGARSFGPPGPGVEWAVYGFYYAFTPCIRRDLVALVGGFYDPYYKAYWGDPDLAMRVWHAGGQVRICLDAWVEFQNAVDDVDAQSKSQFQRRDYEAFVHRWHPVYAGRVKSALFEDINKSIPRAIAGLPPEKCARMSVYLRSFDWVALEEELEFSDGCIVTEGSLPMVVAGALHVHDKIVNTERMGDTLVTKLAKWFSDQLWAGDWPFRTPLERERSMAERALFQGRLDAMAADPYWRGVREAIAPTPLDRSRAELGRFFKMLKPPLKLPQQCQVLGDCGGYGIHCYEPGRYVAWHHAQGIFRTEKLAAADPSWARTDDAVWKVLRWITDQSHQRSDAERSFPDWPEVRQVETAFAVWRDGDVTDNDRIVGSIFRFFTHPVHHEYYCVVEGYHGINVIHHAGEYYAWPQSRGGFDIWAFSRASADPTVFRYARISDVLRRIDDLRGPSSSPSGWSEVRSLEDVRAKAHAMGHRRDAMIELFGEVMPRELTARLVSLVHRNDWTNVMAALNDRVGPNTIDPRNLPHLYRDLYTNRRTMPEEIRAEFSFWLAGCICGIRGPDLGQGKYQISDDRIREIRREL